MSGSFERADLVSKIRFELGTLESMVVFMSSDVQNNGAPEVTQVEEVVRCAGRIKDYCQGWLDGYKSGV